ncbi:hypothetical protein CANARDRAFT_6693 [[Candida] arabinofermentans NRRL YB-2248]|uniref:Uncharacterized protein n=1 Tax=[Candida] arabinofermentans NRRL YB-2248 TaxID=983967 RepID=A0A1E4T3F5_9ASCO|nr:hypothetical protein CANARDRAFT_6693 [[Candida] arabinofermentans NRRL YB-2248]
MVHSDDYISDDDEEFEELRLKRRKLEDLKAELLESIDKQTITITKQDDGAFNLDDYLSACKLINQHSTLPSLNTDKRLNIIRMFYPLMKVTLLQNDITKSMIHYKLEFQNLISFEIKIHFNKRLETLQSLNINILGTCLLYEISMIEKLCNSCILSKDISLFTYSMNSYCDLLKKRINTWGDIYDEYHSEFSINDIKDERDSTKLQNFIKFKNRPFLKLSTVNDNDTITIMTLGWELEFVDDESFIGDCTSKITCSYLLKRGKDNHIIKIVDLNDTLNELIKTNGMNRAFIQLIESVMF